MAHMSATALKRALSIKKEQEPGSALLQRKTSGINAKETSSATRHRMEPKTRLTPAVPAEEEEEGKETGHGSSQGVCDRRDAKEARTRGKGLDCPRHAAPWPVSCVSHAWRTLPTASPHRPPPVGPHYPLSLRDMSRAALTLVPDVSVAAATTATSDGVHVPIAMDMVAIVPSFNGTQKRPTPVVSIGARYTLTPREMRECIRIGRERVQRNRAEGRASRRFSLHRSDDDISIQGVMGELAFARMFDASVDIHDTTCRSAQSETRFDAVMMPEGWTIDVKTTVARDGPMRVACWKAPNPPDAYALLVYTNHDPSRGFDGARGVLPTMEFHGFASAAMVFGAESRVDTVDRDGRPDVLYLVPQGRLLDRAGLAAEMMHERSDHHGNRGSDNHNTRSDGGVDSAENVDDDLLVRNRH